MQGNRRTCQRQVRVHADSRNCACVRLARALYLCPSLTRSQEKTRTRESPLSKLSLILQNDRLTAGLDDAEARMLIEWLVERAEQMSDEGVESLCRRVRSI